MEWIVEPLVGSAIHFGPIQGHPVCPPVSCLLDPCPPWNCGCIMHIGGVGTVHPISG